MKRGVRTILLSVWILVVANWAMADTIVLKDGREFQGLVVKETRTSVEFEALISNISTVMTFSRRDIASIEKGELPEKHAEEKARTPVRERTNRTRDRNPRQRALSDATRYLEIPIKGTFGVEIAPRGVIDTLEYAKKRGIEHIVFRLDSPGGFVWAANEIADAMHKHHEGLTYYAVVEQAISASIWVVFGCDEIFVLPTGRIGAAVVFSKDRSTGAAEVDAKMNSAIAGTLAARAHANGHSPAIVRAMVMQESAVFAVANGDEGFLLTDQEPRGEHDVLDTTQTVLTMTADEAVRYGVARALVSDDALGEVVGLSGWTRFSEYGGAAMRKAAKHLAKSKGELDRLLATVDPLVRVINSNLEEVTQKDPRNASYGYEFDSGAFSSVALQKWRRRTNMTIEAWERAIDACQKLRYVMKKCEEHGVDFDSVSGDLDIDIVELQNRGLREIAWLRENINRNSI